MGVEIDFLPVGRDSKSGDAIALRYGNLHGPRAEQMVIVIDGGFVDDGQKVIDHIRGYYQTNQVDIVLSTHPDQDHIGGLQSIITELTVRQLWMHLPWNHSNQISAAKSSQFRDLHLSEVLEKSLEGASELESTARALGIPILEPFSGLTTPDQAFWIVGPTEDAYTDLLNQIQPRALTALQELLRKAGEAVVGRLLETLDIETLSDNGETTPQNNMSVITYLEYGGHRSLLTADAGIPALSSVAALMERAGHQPGTLDFVQIPHHGSRRNVGPAVLNRLLGPKGQNEVTATAFVSAAVDGGPKHPAKKVTNAFRRRGYKVISTQGQSIRHHRDAPQRAGWGAAVPVPFYDQVDKDEDDS